MKPYKEFAHAAKAKGVEVEAVNMSYVDKKSNKELYDKFTPKTIPTVWYFKNAKDKV